MTMLSIYYYDKTTLSETIAQCCISNNTGLKNAKAFCRYEQILHLSIDGKSVDKETILSMPYKRRKNLRKKGERCVKIWNKDLGLPISQVFPDLI